MFSTIYLRTEALVESVFEDLWHRRKKLLDYINIFVWEK